MRLKFLLVLTFLGVVLAQSASPSQLLQVNPKAEAVSSGSAFTDTQGNILYSWSEDYGVYLKRWDGAKWSLLAKGPAIRGIGIPSGVKVTASSQQKLYLAWNQGRNVAVAAFDANEWRLVGRPFGENVSIPVLRVAADSKGNPIVAYGEDEKGVMVARWNGQRWQNLGNPLNLGLKEPGLTPSMALSKTDQIFVLWRSGGDGNEKKKLILSSYENNQWKTVGEPITENSGGRLGDYAIVLNRKEQPIVVWMEMKKDFGDFGIFAKEWDGAKWKDLGQSSVGNMAVRFELLVNRQGFPVIVYAEDLSQDSINSTIWGKQWDGQEWKTSVKFQFGANVQGYLKSASIDKNGNYLIAWEKESETSPKQLYFNVVKP